MSNKLTLLALLLSVLLLVGWTSSQSQRTVFEYKVVGGLSEKKLNELGAQGWELVAVSPYISGGMTAATEGYMRRVKQ